MTATLSAPTTHKIECPKCKGHKVRKSVSGDMLYWLHVDPETGDTRQGKMIDFIPDGPVDVYQCTDCDYENVCDFMFVTEV